MFQRSIWIPILLLFSCQKTTQQATGPAQFRLLRKEATGLNFQNEIRQSPAFNVFNYMYFFNGGGVGAGDFNNDGSVDLYFTNNMGPNKMFLNKGGMKFQDVTDQAGVAGMDGWTTGVSIIDINNDGMLDIYVGQLGDYRGIKGRNQLFVCKGIEQGIPMYEDEAIYYGLDLLGFSTQAVFFDLDLDGDLDMFQLNHSLHQNGTFGQRSEFMNKAHPLAGDKLLRNDTPRDGKGNAVFTDITEQSGIFHNVIGYGLGVIAGDINNDGYPDLYIANDFHENDYLYINQKNGTFKDMLAQEMPHCSQFSMGVDMADINKDGWNDILTLDMLPEDPYILKSSLGEDTYDLYHFKIGFGYHYQFTRNNLQLNNGDGTFSEIGMFSGVAATDWSWSPLFMDFDNDGNRDLFVSNGIPRRMNDIDYVKFQENNDLELEQNTNNVPEKELQIVEKMPRIKLPNKFYKNGGQLRFADITGAIKDDEPTFSNGAVYADLDNDGDLDVVVNNIEDEPFVYENLNTPSDKQAYLSLQLEGPALNKNAIGARVLVYQKGLLPVTQENYPVRGYQSSAQIPLHIGIGDPAGVDSVVVVWPDQTFERIAAPAFNTISKVTWRQGLPKFNYSKLQLQPANPFAFADATDKIGFTYKHKENPFVEFNREPLIPQMVSREGPALAVGDVNGDGLEDVFLGSAKRERSALYLQQPGGKFALKTSPAILQDSVFEDVDAVFADLENDGDLDLVIASGGNEYKGKEEPLKQRAYLNDGKGNFSRIDPFPTLFMTASCVLPADFNGDGLVDFFFGGRAVPEKYGVTPNSYLLQNKGNGQFEEVTASVAPALQTPGLVKSGAWADMNADGKPDLVLAIEWEPITIFYNKNGRLEPQTVDQDKGWWNFALPEDVDGDGDLDLLAGNMGENSRLKPTAEEPIRLYVNDFDDNGHTEPILSYYLKGREIPFANFEEIMKQMPSMKKKYLYSKDFAKASLEDMFGKAKLSAAVHREATTFESRYYENTGNGFKAHTLPDRLQFSTLNAAYSGDFNGDGRKDLLLGGNFFDCNIEMGRYDAFYGAVLSIDNQQNAAVYPLGAVRVQGQTKRIRPIHINGRLYYIFARNNDRALILEAVKKTS